MNNLINEYVPNRNIWNATENNIQQKPGAVSVKTRETANRLSLILMQVFFIIFIMSSNVFAQTEPPFLQWQFTGDATNGTPDGEDWIYDIIETADGGFLSVGFADIFYDEHLPSFIKLDANGNHLWDEIVDLGEPHSQGNLQTVKELDDGHFVMFGNKDVNGVSHLMLHEIDAAGNAISGFPKLFMPGITGIELALGFSLELVKNTQGVVTAYTVTGLYRKSNGLNTGFIMKIDKNGLETGFGTKTIIDASAENSVIRSHTNIYENSVHTGYVLCGLVKDPLNEETDAYITRIDLNGNTIWEHRLTKAGLVNQGIYTDEYDYFGGTKELETGETSYFRACEDGHLCDDGDPNFELLYTNNNEQGFDVVQAPDGNIIVNAYFDYYNCYCPLGSGDDDINGIFKKPYIATDAVIIKVNPSNGQAISSNNYRYFAGIDYFLRIKILEGQNSSDYNIVSIGNNPHIDENGVPIRMMGELLMLDKDGGRIWFKRFNDNSKEYCMFGLTLTSDGGYMVAGNNEMDIIVNGQEIETENYVAIKLHHDCPPFNSTTLYLTEDTEWVIPKRIKQDVIIGPGVTLTIKDEVYFSKNAHLIVEVGAKLELDGALLTNSCDGDYWPGVQVFGTSGGAQNPLEQGWVTMTNGSIIENATTGIVANDYFNPDGWKHGHTGGIIHAGNSKFVNNVIAVQFDTYESYSVSSFNNCEFITDSEYPFPYNPFAFVKIVNHYGSSYRVCSFSNTNFNIYNPQDKGKGIYSSNGGFSVTQQSSFNNLHYGIYGLGTLAQNVFYVRDATFNTYRGIYMSAYHNNQITGNTFNIPISVSGSNNNSYGLYMQGSTSYKVEDNTFNGLTSSPSEIGLYINSSGPDNNEVYRNNFDNLHYGIIAQDINRDNDENGLYIKCNIFTNMVSDISVTSNSPIHPLNYGIAKFQGADSPDPTLMAGNLFYYNTILNDFDDLNNGLASFTYYYPLNTDPGFNIVNPLDITENTITKIGTEVFPTWSYSNGCPPSGGGGGDERGALRTMMSSSAQQADSTASVLVVRVDGGDTPQLANDVELGTPPETVDLYNELMNKSPYLSDSVVESAIVNEDLMPNAMLRDIMVANAHSAKSEALMTTLDDRWDPMPDYMKAQVLEGRSIVSLKEETESRLGAFQLKKSNAFNGLAHYFMADTLNAAASLDSLSALLASGTTLNAHYQLALLHFNNGEYSQGNNELSNIPVNFTLDDDELAAHQNMVSYYNWLTAVKQSQGNIMWPNSAEQQQLWNISMADSSHAGIFARNLLVAMGETTYSEPIVLPDLYKSSQAMADYNELLNTEAPGLIKVFPSPASAYVILEYKLETDAEASISIQNISGITIKTFKTKRQQDQITLITRDWVPGTYIASLKVNGKLLESVKFTVIN